MFFRFMLDLWPSLPDEMNQKKAFYLHFCNQTAAPKIYCDACNKMATIFFGGNVPSVTNICCRPLKNHLSCCFVHNVHKIKKKKKIQVLLVVYTMCWLSASAVHNQFLFSLQLRIIISSDHFVHSYSHFPLCDFECENVVFGCQTIFEETFFF